MSRPDLGPERFAGFFADLHGYGPFPWQERLAQRVAPGGGEWPRYLALPTGSGKTAALDVAVFALAAQALLPAAERTAPRRIFFVVDRRVIVDEAYERVRRIAGKLAAAREGILAEVASRLREVGGLGPAKPPLAVYQLRGGVWRDDAWARTPLAPAVVATTVDQVGSRLLFRGYGRASGSWPIHAGLAGHDALLLLDEAHVARPFEETLEAIAGGAPGYRGARWAERPIASPFAFVRMSATPRGQAGEPGEAGGEGGPAGLATGGTAAEAVAGGAAREAGLGLEDEDRANEVLARRLGAAKPARLLPLRDELGGPRYRAALLDQVERVIAAGHRRVAVLVNRVALARELHRELRERAHGGAGAKGASGSSPADVAEPRFDTLLLVGRMRPIDRDRVMDEWQPSLRSDSDEKLDRPVVAVATQCLEVGADLDFDALVTECASLDALRQRFGRLDRLGKVEERIGRVAEGVVVVTREQIGKRAAPDPIYGEALGATWRFLDERGETRDGGRVVDFGIDAMDELLAAAGDRRGELSAAPPATAALLPAHLDLLVQTSPAPAVDPDLAPFLHGADRTPPDVLVCWRADLAPPAPGEAIGVTKSRWTDVVALAPPLAAECMPVPLHVVRGWLAGEREPDANLSDLEAAPAEPAERRPPGSGGPSRRVLRWLGPEDSEAVDDREKLRPGDTVVVPEALGGWEVFGHVPEADAPAVREPGPGEPGGSPGGRDGAAGSAGTSGPARGGEPEGGRVVDEGGRAAAASGSARKEEPGRGFGAIDVAEEAGLAPGRRPFLRLHPALVERWSCGTEEAEAARAELLALAARRELAEEDEERVVALLRGEVEKRDVEGPSERGGGAAETGAGSGEPGRPSAAGAGDGTSAGTVEREAGDAEEGGSLGPASPLPERLRGLAPYLDRRNVQFVSYPWPESEPAELAAGSSSPSETPGAGAGWLLRSRRRVPVRRADESRPETFGSEDDVASASVEPVPLAAHGAAVAAKAREWCEQLGLPELAETVALAASLHDLGKADPRFQAWLHGGNRIAARLAPEPLAKGVRRLSRSEDYRARRAAGWPEGKRHELVSWQLAASCRELVGRAADPDLLAHLIVSHHGRCRPLPPPVDDPGGAQVEVGFDGLRLTARPEPSGRLGAGHAERFWRLVRRYGWWGLAHLEAVVRLADHRVSEEEEEEEEAVAPSSSPGVAGGEGAAGGEEEPGAGRAGAGGGGAAGGPERRAGKGAS